jgi:hypothetical protein
MDSEKELFDAFERVVHEDFPNPQRIACPAREVLLKLAQRPADTQFASLLVHIRQWLPALMSSKTCGKKGEFNNPEILPARTLAASMTRTVPARRG